MFRGEYDYNLDEKGRMLIPLRFREELGDAVVLTRGGDGQVNVFPKAYFAEMDQRVQESGDHDDIRMALRILNSAVDTEVDRQGRIMIPLLLRRHAELGSDVVVLGNGTHLEIWNPEKWQKAYDKWVTDYRATPDDYGKVKQAGLRL